jgi:hypothetical protein
VGNDRQDVSPNNVGLVARASLAPAPAQRHCPPSLPKLPSVQAAVVKSVEETEGCSIHVHTFQPPKELIHYKDGRYRERIEI